MGKQGQDKEGALGKGRQDKGEVLGRERQDREMMMEKEIRLPKAGGYPHGPEA
jgi:hypothetical protein